MAEVLAEHEMENSPVPMQVILRIIRARAAALRGDS